METCRLTNWTGFPRTKGVLVSGTFSAKSMKVPGKQQRTRCLTFHFLFHLGTCLNYISPPPWSLEWPWDLGLVNGWVMMRWLKPPRLGPWENRSEWSARLLPLPLMGWRRPSNLGSDRALVRWIPEWPKYSALPQELGSIVEWARVLPPLGILKFASVANLC